MATTEERDFRENLNILDDDEMKKHKVMLMIETMERKRMALNENGLIIIISATTATVIITIMFPKFRGVGLNCLPYKKMQSRTHSDKLGG